MCQKYIFISKYNIYCSLILIDLAEAGRWRPNCQATWTSSAWGEALQKMAGAMLGRDYSTVIF